MIVVIPFCAKDGHLAVKNLGFCIFLEQSVPFDALLSYDNETPPELIERVRKLAKQYFKSVREHQYHAPWNKGWPQAANHAFQMAARHISSEIQEPWLWWEADAVPLRKKWLADIAAEYEKALAHNKCFMGHLVQGVIQGGHMNGVGVYPSDVGAYSRNAMLSMNAAWDVAMANQMRGHLYAANNLFQHCWATDASGSPTNGAGEIPTFKSWHDVAEGPHRADFRAALYHRCKDGSFIDQYMSKVAAGAVPSHTSEALRKRANVMPGNKKKAGRPARKHEPVGCRILIVTYFKDFPWLKYCLDAIEKFGSGFDGTTVCIPLDDLDEYHHVIGIRENVQIRRFNEREGKGMVHHMERLCSADEVCFSQKPKYILHFDADTIAQEPFTPEDYIEDGKPIYVVRPYESLIDKDRGVISDCYQWKKVAERALGEEINMYTMCRHPTCFPVGFYKPFREHIAKAQGMPFDEFVLAQENKFPQGFAEFPTMGAWAWTHMHDAFKWVDISKDEVPRDLTKTYWSHAGLDQIMPSALSAREEIERVLADSAEPVPA